MNPYELPDTFEEWLTAEMSKPENAGNILAPEMDQATFEHYLHNELLTDGWYIGYSCNAGQARTEMLAELIRLYGKPKWRRQMEKFFSRLAGRVRTALKRIARK